ncbi:MAG TPA: glycosyltransferase N-terminal domain-containing protein, partial [Longimicrobiaceae bacterium]|nr:glycosyltransferase N-terminal domain-containing protein [Longimicrobiaceae bacterium]
MAAADAVREAAAAVTRDTPPTWLYLAAMNTPEALYTAVASIAARILPLVAAGTGKFSRAVRGMSSSVGGFEAWAAVDRDPARPLVWFHAPSVGEGYQARAVMEALRALRPDIQTAYTFLSPSAEPFARTAPADVVGFLPLEKASHVSRMFEALMPSALVFTKTEVWPRFVLEAERRNVPTALVSATLPSDSSRLRLPARLLLAPVHARLSRIAAISRDDALRYASLTRDPDLVVVVGDPRFDQVARRASLVDRAHGVVTSLPGAKKATVVAGSTWAADEYRLVPGFAACLRDGIAARLIVAPHEPTEAHLARLEALLSAHALHHARLGVVSTS